MQFITPAVLLAVPIVLSIGSLIVWQFNVLHKRIDKRDEQMKEVISEFSGVCKEVVRLGEMHRRDECHGRRN